MSSQTLNKDPIYGEINCHKCKNKAYWKVQNDTVEYLCGVHSKKYQNRVELKKDAKLKAKLMDEKYQMQQKECSEAALNNKNTKKRGDVICSKLYMMKNPEDVHGYIKVFPNFKHGGRKDGLGYPSLSPKSMGPIYHNQPGLPPAKSLENFHQGNKVFITETDANKEPLESWYQTQLDMYTNDKPIRHKDAALDDKGKRINAPLYSLWVDAQGIKHKISYFESRQFYCSYYEREVLKVGTKANKDYMYLCNLLDEGYNLQIIGYDAYNVTKSLEECYLDISRPFGHELVLYSMLTLKSEEYPWQKYKTFDF